MKLPISMEEYLPVLIRALSPRLLNTLFGIGRECAIRLGTRMTLEIYLASLCLSFPKEMSAMFYESGSVHKLVNHFWGEHVPMSENLEPKFVAGPEMITFLRLDDRLTYFLW